MNYYVVAEDGQKYGPADVNTLNQWAQEGRLQPTSILEDVTTGARLHASQIVGINFHIAPNPNFQQPSYGQSSQFIGDNGSGDITLVWVFSAASFLCCPLFAIAAIVFAARAQQKGHMQAQTALIVAVLALCLSGGFCCGIQSLAPRFSNFN